MTYVLKLAIICVVLEIIVGDLMGIKARIFNIMQYEKHPETGKYLMTEEKIKDALLHRTIERWAYIYHDKDVYTEFSYDPHSSIVTIDRTRSVPGKVIDGRRTTKVRNRDGSIDLRILLDRFSAEIFINDGEQVITTTLETPPEIQGITFSCTGKAIMNISKYELDK